MFEDLEAVPGPSAIVFGDTQKINYLLSAIKHERSQQPVYVQIQTDQLRGRITFEQACDDLRYRCESNRADEMLNSQVKSSKVRGFIANAPDSLDSAGEPSGTGAASAPTALITSAAKRQNADPGKRVKKDPTPCLATGCTSTVPPHIRLCRLHYHECISGKQAKLPLRTGGTAHYDASTNKMIYSTTVIGANTASNTKKVTIRAGVALPLPPPGHTFPPCGGDPAMLGPLTLHVPVLPPHERDQTLPPHESSQTSLRINNVSTQLNEGRVNGDTRVAECDCTLALSSRSFRVEVGGVQSASVERVRYQNEVPSSTDLSSNSSSVVCLSCPVPALCTVFHVDSGAGQSICCNEDAFISLRACAIEVVGVSGSLAVYGVGTAVFVATDHLGATAILFLHNCL
jgi:hypothetical protein